MIVYDKPQPNKQAIYIIMRTPKDVFHQVFLELLYGEVYGAESLLLERVN